MYSTGWLQSKLLWIKVSATIYICHQYNNYTTTATTTNKMLTEQVKIQTYRLSTEQKSGKTLV